MRSITRSIICLLAAATLTNPLMSCSRRVKEATIEGGCSHLVGAVFPMTGDLSGFGQTSEKGLRLALEDMELAGSGACANLRVEDGRGDTSTSLAAYERLVRSGARVVVTNLSHVALALAGRAEAGEVVLFADAAHPELTPENVDDSYLPSVFRHSSVASQEGRLLAAAIPDMVRGSGRITVSVALVNNEYGTAVARAFETAAAEAGSISLADQVRYDPTETHFLAVTDALTSSNPQAVVLVGYSRSLGQLINFLRDSDFRGEIFCTVGLMATEDAVNVAGANLQGAYYNAFELEEDAQYLKMVERYRQKYASEPPQNAILMYNTGLLIRRVLPQEPPIVQEILSRDILSLGTFDAAGEVISIEPNGDLLPRLRVRRYER